MTAVVRCYFYLTHEPEHGGIVVIETSLDFHVSRVVKQIPEIVQLNLEEKHAFKHAETEQVSASGTCKVDNCNQPYLQ